MKPFTIACCQIESHGIDDAEANLAGMLRALDQAAAAGAQLVLLPECSYPAYYLGGSDPYARPGVRPFAEVSAMLGAKAKEHGFWLAAGLAVPHDDGSVTNSGVVFGLDGEQRGRYDKSFLWHFDNNWFTPGREFPVWDTGFCRFGVLICADGRQPEISRMLSLNGAEVICDLTAWVSWATAPEALSNPQCEYMMPVRAFENGAWVAAADKWGAEAGSIVYAGRSTVIDPLGVTRVCAPSTGDAVVTYRLEPVEAAPIQRRPALYRTLVAPAESLPAAAREHEPIVPAASAARVAVVPGGEAWDAGRAARRFATLRAQACDIAVFACEPGMEGWEVSLPVIEAAVREHGGAAVVAVATNACHWRQSAAIVTPGKTHDHQATHGRGLELGESPAPVIATPAGNLGVLVGDEALVPEVARCLALQGADILAWTGFEHGAMTERIARTRADENKVAVAAAFPGGGFVAGPDGGLLTAVPEGLDVAMTASINLAATRLKDRAPGTNVVRGRTPELYGPLVR